MTVCKLRSLQVLLGAVVLSFAGMATAQVQAKSEPEAAMEATKPMPKRHHHKPRAHKRPMGQGEMGQMQSGASQNMNQYQRNALARCNVFKGEVSQMACVARIENGPVAGSVQGGGTLYEATIETIKP